MFVVRQYEYTKCFAMVVTRIGDVCNANFHDDYLQLWGSRTRATVLFVRPAAVVMPVFREPIYFNLLAHCVIVCV